MATAETAVADEELTSESKSQAQTLAAAPEGRSERASTRGLTNAQVEQGLYYDGDSGIAAKLSVNGTTQTWSLGGIVKDVLEKALDMKDIENPDHYTGLLNIVHDGVDIRCMEAGVEQGDTSVVYATGVQISLVLDLRRNPADNKCFSAPQYLGRMAPCMDGEFRTTIICPELLIKVSHGIAHIDKGTIETWQIRDSSFTRTTSGFQGMVVSAIVALANKLVNYILPFVSENIQESISAAVTHQTNNKFVRAALWALRLPDRISNMDWRVTTTFDCT